MGSQAPPSTLPPGYHDDDRPVIGGLLVLFMVLATAPVILRVACQLRVHRRLFWDDFWIICACVLVDGASAVNHFGLSKGLGLHAFRVRVEDPSPPIAFITLWKVGFVGNILNSLSLFTVKISLLLLYRRVFWIARWFRIAWWANLVYACAWIVEALFTGIFRCVPVSYAWNRIYLWMHIAPPFPVEGSCISEWFVTVNSALSLASDLGIWALPMAALVKLQISKKRKLGLIALLSLGVLAVVCGIGKAVSGYGSLNTTDTSWSVAPFVIWSEAEQAVAIMCACLPTIVGGIRNILNKRKESTRASPYRSAASGNRQAPQSERNQSKRSSMTQALRAERSLEDEDLEALPHRKWEEHEAGWHHSIEMVHFPQDTKTLPPPP